MTVLLHRIGNEKHSSNFNTREEILAVPREETLTFDGVYKSVFDNRDILTDRKVILFIIGDAIGGSSTLYPQPGPDEPFCTWEEIGEFGDAELGWHSKTHRDLTLIPEEELEDEIKPPFPMQHFAYPYGKFNEKVLEVVKKYYKYAWSVTTGDDSDYQRLRRYI